jgi:hypothetical protein
LPGWIVARSEERDPVSAKEQDRLIDEIRSALGAVPLVQETFYVGHATYAERRLLPLLAVARFAGWVAGSVALLLLTACASDAPAEWGGSIDTLPTGIIHVSNPEQGLWGDEPPWQVVELTKIGTQLGSGPGVFGYVSDVDVDRLGRIYVLDSQAQEVRVFGITVRTYEQLGGWAVARRSSTSPEVWPSIPQGGCGSWINTICATACSIRAVCCGENPAGRPGFLFGVTL